VFLHQIQIDGKLQDPCSLIVLSDIELEPVLVEPLEVLGDDSSLKQVVHVQLE